MLPTAVMQCIAKKNPDTPNLNLLAKITVAAIIALLTLAQPARAQDRQVNIYSYRQPILLEKLLEDFTDKTGIRTNVVFAKKGLLQRIDIEGTNSPADILLSTDIGVLQRAAKNNAQPVTDIEELYSQIPAKLRSKNSKWFALTMRARVVYAAKERVKEKIQTYESLADEKWKNEICIRSGQHSYNLGLIAAMITHHGRGYTKNWLSGIKNNLARKPGGNDRAQIKAIYANECDISIGNTYYMGLMLNNKKNPEQKEWAKAVSLHFLKFQNGGTHVNVSGMMMAKFAPNPQEARELMRYLISPGAQKIYADVNHEYPVRADVKPSKLVQSWGSLDHDNISIQDIGDNISAASRIVDQVGFNE